MLEIHINLKRFDVPRNLGGLCPEEDANRWISGVLRESAESGLGSIDGIRINYLLPEGLLAAAAATLADLAGESKRNLTIGSQGVFRDDVTPGGNFGAFTSNLPATAARCLGASWSIIGHSEERKDKEEILAAYDPAISTDSGRLDTAARTVNGLLNREVAAAAKVGLNVLYCVGETAEERGSGDFEQQKPRIREVLRGQLEIGLKDMPAPGNADSVQLVIGYEPRWAIGPGKTPPGDEYIGFVSSYIKEVCQDILGTGIPVIYGGGLKEENAAMIGGISTIDGGLVALTRFTGEIGFHVSDLKKIVDLYRTTKEK